MKAGTNQLIIAILQFEPVHSNIESNINHVENILLSKLELLINLDIILLPEMAFTGYVFNSRLEIVFD
jgi:predicted amidohydrolase